MTYYLIVILTVFAAACAQMLLKKSANLYSDISRENVQKKVWAFLRQYLNPWVLGGYAIMFVCLVINIYAMNKGIQAKEVSTIESLSYLFVPSLSYVCFRECITWRKVGAIAMIIMGIVIFFS